MGNNSSMSAMGFALKLLGLRGHSCKELEVKLLKKDKSIISKSFYTKMKFECNRKKQKDNARCKSFLLLMSDG